MSFAVKTVSAVQPTFGDAKQLLKDIQSVFLAASECLYHARNEIRRTRYAELDVVIKAFKVPGHVNRLIYGYVRKSKARRSYENSLRLQSMGFLTPAPIGYKEVYRWGMFAQSYYVSAYVQTDYKLEDVLHREPVKNRDAVLQAFGVFVYHLHAQGVLHRDLSPGNVLVRIANDDYLFYLVDTNRMAFGHLAEPVRYKNFAMLWAKDKDLRLIIDAYAKVSGLNADAVYQQVLLYSHAHKARSARKEKLKRWLGK